MIRAINDGPFPAKEVTLGGEIYPNAAKYLQEQGCTIIPDGGGTTIKYPEGTIRQELYPRTSDIRYRIILPDGSELREVLNRVTDRCSLSGPWKT